MQCPKHSKQPTLQLDALLAALKYFAKDHRASGATTFTTELYKGSISKKEIVKRSGILNKNLWDDNDSIMADRGFTIQNELAPSNVKLSIPSFFGDRAQLIEAEVKKLRQ